VLTLNCGQICAVEDARSAARFDAPGINKELGGGNELALGSDTVGNRFPASFPTQRITQVVCVKSDGL